HAAPWSTGSQGYANVSHGCTGMSMGNAAWFYDTRGAGTTSLRDVQGGRSLRSRCPRDAWADPSAALQDPVGPAAARPARRAVHARPLRACQVRLVGSPVGELGSPADSWAGPLRSPA
ncbi:L,D-transpeptidase, partial [Streptomyces griseiscabiei]